MLLSATTVVWSGLWFAVMWWFVIQFFFDVSLNISCTKPLKRHVVLVRACETRRNPVKKRVEVNQLEAREPRSIKWLAVDVSQWSLLTRWKRPASHWTRRPRTLAASVSFFFAAAAAAAAASRRLLLHSAAILFDVVFLYFGTPVLVDTRNRSRWRSIDSSHDLDLDSYVQQMLLCIPLILLIHRCAFRA